MSPGLVIVISISLLAQMHHAMAHEGHDTWNTPCTIALSPWVAAAPIPTFHLQPASAVINNNLFVIGGFDTNQLDPQTRVHTYDPVENSWKLLPSQTPLNGSHAQACSDHERFIFLIGGFAGKNPGPAVKTAFRYDAMLDLWEPLPDLPSPLASAGVACVPRSSGSTEVHVIGGLLDRDTDTNAHLSILVRPDPISSQRIAWMQQETPIPFARNHAQAVHIPSTGSLLVAGGQNRHDTNPVDSDRIDTYDLVSKIWLFTPGALKQPRSHAEPATLLVYSNLVLFGGRNNKAAAGKSQIIDTIEAVDSFSLTSTVVGKMPDQRQAPSAAFFRNVRIGSTFGDYIFLTAGGRDYNDASKLSWIARVISNCSSPEPVPVEASPAEGSPCTSPAPTPQVVDTPSFQQPPTGSVPIEAPKPRGGASSANLIYPSPAKILTFTCIFILNMHFWLSFL